MNKYSVPQMDSAKNPDSSENQLTLAVFDSIPVVEASPKARKPKAEFYIRVHAGDGWHFLWKTHANGGPEWEHEFALTINGGNKKPLRYKTLNGAKRMMRFYLYPDAVCEVAAWREV